MNFTGKDKKGLYILAQMKCMDVGGFGYYSMNLKKMDEKDFFNI